MVSRWACDVIAGLACDNRAALRPAERLERIMPDFPSGTVTFLFTDIEGSTAQWEQDQVAMAAAVAQHFALLDRVDNPQQCDRNNNEGKRKATH
jgi:class 3 adenylate cyclase